MISWEQLLQLTCILLKTFASKSYLSLWDCARRVKDALDPWNKLWRVWWRLQRRKMGKLLSCGELRNFSGASLFPENPQRSGGILWASMQMSLEKGPTESRWLSQDSFINEQRKEFQQPLQLESFCSYHIKLTLLPAILQYWPQGCFYEAN